MNVRFDENVDAAYTVEVDFYIFVLVPIAHPIQGSAMHVVLFVACASRRSWFRKCSRNSTKECDRLYLRLRRRLYQDGFASSVPTRILARSCSRLNVVKLVFSVLDYSQGV